MARDTRVDVLLFDLGGVIVELAGLPVWTRWTGHDEAESWTRWLRSPAVRRFESGRASATEFAEDVVREFELPVAPEVFLAEFERWPTGPYPGALELLAGLAPRFRLACLTNTNSLHWPRFLADMGLRDAFDQHFASHELGAMKPDREIFELVLEALGCRPERVLFLDDNAVNVDGARDAGLEACQVRGIEGARQALRERNLL